MPTFFVISIVLQALLIVHCIKTGRNTIWIWVIALLSYAGIVAYIAVELLPDLFGSRTARRAGRSMKRMLDPHGDLRRYEQQARVGVNVANLQRYADELVRQGRYDEAIAEYRKALTGLYENDPNLMLGIARAQFDKGDATAARTTLDDLIRLNPDFRSHEGHLLYARALEGEGNFAKAMEEYKVLAPGYPGAEGAVRYAQLLKSQGQGEESRKIAQELLDGARVAPAHYRRAQRFWLDQAEKLAAG
jgi:hypothetical protein